LAWHDLAPDGKQRRLNIMTANEEEINEFCRLARYVETKEVSINRHWVWDIHPNSLIRRSWLAIFPVFGLLLKTMVNWSGEYFPKFQSWLNKTFMGEPFGASTYVIWWCLTEAPLSKLRYSKYGDLQNRGKPSLARFFPRWPEINNRGRFYLRADGASRKMVLGFSGGKYW
jgi:hypothetical protein